MFASCPTASITRGAFASMALDPPFSSLPLATLGDEPMLLRLATCFGSCHIASQLVRAETVDSNARILVANTALTGMAMTRRKRFSPVRERDDNGQSSTTISSRKLTRSEEARKGFLWSKIYNS